MKLRLLFSMLFAAMVTFAFGQSIGIIGTATPTGWDSDTDLVQDATDPSKWTLTIALVAGEAKFRANDAWDINWGATDFPAGIGVAGGPNIPIPAAGIYDIDFNDTSGAYNFQVRSDIGIIGTATVGGWDYDTNMFQDLVDTNQYSLTIVLNVGAAKLRQNDAWTANWGSADYPTGIGTQGGADIPIPAANKYLVTFNKMTGAYSFTEVVEYITMGVIGTAQAGGWDTDSDLVRDPGDPNVWRNNLILTDGAAKFRANDAWTYSWGDTLFPSGVALPGGPDIPVTAGEYQVTFNSESLEYSFLPIVEYATVGIIGDATPGGWDNDTDMDRDPDIKYIWKKRIILTDGEAKFRANDDWPVNWGAGDFPTGVATLDGANIPVTAGEYVVTFNSTTGEYDFELLLVYNTIGLVGTGTPLMSWDTDVDMTKDAVDESFWYINSIDIVDGFCKFRAEDLWAVNWGLASFPTGVGTQDGADIPTVAGTYRVTLNSATGEYAFGDPVSAQDILQSIVIALSPNPAAQFVNIEVKDKSLQGDVRIIVFDQQGKQVMTQSLNLQDNTVLNISALNAGNYTLHIANDKYMVGKKLVVIK